MLIAFNDADQTDLHVIAAETGTEFLFSVLNNILIHNITVVCVMMSQFFGEDAGLFCLCT